MSPELVTAKDVSRRFRDVVALTRVSFSIGPGVTGLLGPNGAGKTSMIRILVGLHPPSGGSVRVMGADPRRDLAARAALGYVPEAAAPPSGLAARRFLRTLALQHGLADADARATHVLGTVGLDPTDRRPTATYSKGMVQRVKVAAALVHDPAVLVLDEPLNGLDPTARVEMIDLLRRLGEEGRCVLVSSHVLHEVERFAPRVLVLVQGRLVADGDHHAIRDLMDAEPRIVRVTTDRPRELAARLVTASLCQRVEVADETVLVETSTPAAFRELVAATARETGARLREVVPLDEDLDSVFAYLVQRSGRS